MLKSLFIYVAILGFTFSAQAIPFHKPPPKKLPPSFSRNYSFEAIVALDNCSGGLVRFENSQDTDHALVFTNGHCNENGFLDLNAFLSHQQSSRSFTLFDASLNQVATLSATELVYATMTKTDLAVYQLKESYADILNNYKIQALTLASKPAVAGLSMDVLSGYWQRGYSCTVESIVPHLHEGDWIWDDSLRYSRPGCETIGGTSGSPVIQSGTRVMIAINNTGSESGEKCTVNNPCEVDLNGNISFTKGFSYGQQTSLVYSCLNSSREIDLNVAGCLLPH